MMSIRMLCEVAGTSLGNAKTATYSLLVSVVEDVDVDVLNEDDVENVVDDIEDTDVVDDMDVLVVVITVVLVEDGVLTLLAVL